MEQRDTRISAQLTRIETLLVAFDAQPTKAGWRTLRVAHRRYVTTHAIFPGSREHQVIARLWRAVWRGPFLVRGTTPEAVLAALQVQLAAGEVIRIAVPFVVGERRLRDTYPCTEAEDSWYTTLDDAAWGSSDGLRVVMLSPEQVAAALAHRVSAE